MGEGCCTCAVPLQPISALPHVFWGRGVVGVRAFVDKQDVHRLEDDHHGDQRHLLCLVHPARTSCHPLVQRDAEAQDIGPNSSGGFGDGGG